MFLPSIYFAYLLCKKRLLEVVVQYVTNMIFFCLLRIPRKGPRYALSLDGSHCKSGWSRILCSKGVGSLFF